MGTYLNPGNTGFSEVLSSDYIDKSGMISLINHSIGTRKKLTCISRPRRFGKSFAAQMLCAYYDRTCDSRELFDRLQISKEPDYKKYMNKFDVIYLDMTGIKPYTDGFREIVPFLVGVLTREIIERYPDVMESDDFSTVLINAVEKSGNKIIIIIDEWDAPIRETPEVQNEYLEFLRSLFKNSGTTSRIFAAAYMTGILPIKKDENQSAVSDFEEYSVLEPGDFAEYVGFTEEEVRKKCTDFGVSYETMKKWYDGYSTGNIKSVYNPYSVMESIHSGKFRSYWKKTSAAETLTTYIDMDQDGLQGDIARLITGESVEVDTGSFQNDINSFSCKDDVLTLLIHLGYLTYEEIEESYGDDNEISGFVRIPNEEVRTEFKKILRRSNHKELTNLVSRSDKLLSETIACNEEEVERVIQSVHDSSYAPTFYNNEQSLRYVIKMAYISCVDQYAKVEELPSGRGIADVVFLPKKRSALPAMIVELKWNKDAESAIKQIRNKNYPEVLRAYIGEALLVGISYDERSKKHTCKIEKMTLQ